LSVLESTYTKVVDDNAVDSYAKLLWLQIFGRERPVCSWLASLSTVLHADHSQLSLASADAIGGYVREEIAARRLEGYLMSISMLASIFERE
jgi:hypothetical protein